DEDGSGVVRVGALAQHAAGVRAVDEHVPARRQTGDVDRLALLLGDVVVAEPDGDPLAHRPCTGLPAPALARPYGLAVKRPRLVGVAQAEPGFPVAPHQRAVAGTPQLVALEPGQMPVLV